MSRLLTTLLLAITCYLGAPRWRTVLGPDPSPAAYQQLVAAERAFAAFTRAHGVKAGFTRFLAEDALLIANGRYQLGKPLFENMPARPGVLSWQPTYAAVAASGDFGYTTGPFDMRPAQTTDAPVGFGQFTSVWRKTRTGPWQVLADVGITYAAPGPPETPNLRPPATPTPAPRPAADTAAQRRALLTCEARFAARAAQSLRAAYWAVLQGSPTVRLYRTGHLPYVGAAATAFAAQQTAPATYSDVRAVVAPSGDLGFTYGYGRVQEKQGPFLRIWQRRPPGAWQLVHEVLDAR